MTSIDNDGGMDKKQWAIVQVGSNLEARVKQALLNLVKLESLEEQIGDIFIPMESVEEIYNGKPRVVKKKLYPGYVFIRMIVNDANCAIVRKIAGVLKFLKDTSINAILGDDIMKMIQDDVEEKSNKPRPRIHLKPGDSVRVLEGPFCNHTGIVDSVSKGRVVVMCSVFGRSTPVIAEISQVEKPN